MGKRVLINIKMAKTLTEKLSHLPRIRAKTEETTPKEPIEIAEISYKTVYPEGIPKRKKVVYTIGVKTFPVSIERPNGNVEDTQLLYCEEIDLDTNKTSNEVKNTNLSNLTDYNVIRNI